MSRTPTESSDKILMIKVKISVESHTVVTSEALGTCFFAEGCCTSVRRPVLIASPTPLSVTGRLHGTIVGPTGRSTSRMKRLQVPIVGPTGRSDPGYVRLSVRPVGQTGWTDCSRTAHICQSNQCGLLANYNTAYAAA